MSTTQKASLGLPTLPFSIKDSQSMPIRETLVSRKLRSPVWVWGIVLLVVFAVEIVVMLSIAHLAPDGINETAEAFVDAILLTLICAPLLWFVMISPLRRIAIRENERSETIVANAGEGILTFSDTGVVSTCNNAAAQLFGISENEFIGNQIHSILPKLDWNDSANSHQRILGKTIIGGTIPIQVSISKLPSTNSLIAIVRDLTEAEAAENQRIQAARETEALRAQQMATLAQLATGVAHEIRNPLTAIKMMIQVNRTRFSEQGLPTEDLELVEQEIRRMERSIKGLLEYARPEAPEFVQFNLLQAINKTLRLISGQCASQNVKVVTELPDKPMEISGDPLQIQQLLLNLCLNALDAMPVGGSIKIKAETLDASARVTITDSGTGIPAEVLSDLFAPFVTTKPDGVGLGLGICRRIAESHYGRLTGRNADQDGAVFQLDLPLNPATKNIQPRNGEQRAAITGH